MAKTALETISLYVNRVLSLDVEFVRCLAPLNQKVIRVDIRGFDFSFDIRVSEIGIAMLRSNDSEKADVQISGAPLSLLRLLMEGSSESRSQGSGVSVQGDLRVAQQLAELSGQLDIDWEEIISKGVGDVPAHYVGRWFHDMNLWRERSQQSFLAAISDYLQEEARVLPTKIEVDHFVSDVGILCEAVACLEDRVIKLNSRTN